MLNQNSSAGGSFVSSELGLSPSCDRKEASQTISSVSEIEPALQNTVVGAKWLEMMVGEAEIRNGLGGFQIARNGLGGFPTARNGSWESGIVNEKQW